WTCLRSSIRPWNWIVRTTGLWCCSQFAPPHLLECRRPLSSAPIMPVGRHLYRGTLAKILDEVVAVTASAADSARLKPTRRKWPKLACDRYRRVGDFPGRMLRSRGPASIYRPSNEGRQYPAAKSPRRGPSKRVRKKKPPPFEALAGRSHL